MSAQKKYKMYENPIMEFLSISGPKMMITYYCHPSKFLKAQNSGFPGYLG
jgi:hypothetical protein